MGVEIKVPSLEAAMGSRLRSHRLALNVSLGNLAELSTVPIDVLRIAEEGNGRLPPRAVLAVARALQVSPSCFFQDHH